MAILTLRARKGTGSKDDCIKVIHDVLQLYHVLFALSNMLTNETIHDWYLTYNAFDKTPGKWNLTMLAEDICKFDDIL